MFLTILKCGTNDVSAESQEKVSASLFILSKSYNKLKHEEMLFHADVSDEDDRANSQDASTTSITCNTMNF